MKPKKNLEPLTFLPSPFVIIPLPYRNPKVNIWKKSYNGYSMTLSSMTGQGIPYSRYGRLALSLLTTKAIQTSNNVIDLGGISQTLRVLGITKNGNAIKRLPDQIKKIADTSLSFSYEGNINGENALIQKNLRLASKLEFYWGSEKNKNQLDLFKNQITLSPEYFEYIKNHPIPLDLRIYTKLKSAMSQDIYAWLIRRTYRSTKKISISWTSIYEQFGPVKPTAKPRFRQNFEKSLLEVKTFWPDLRIDLDINGLELKPSRQKIELEGIVPQLFK